MTVVRWDSLCRDCPLQKSTLVPFSHNYLHMKRYIYHMPNNWTSATEAVNHKTDVLVILEDLLLSNPHQTFLQTSSQLLHIWLCCSAISLKHATFQGISVYFFNLYGPYETRPDYSDEFEQMIAQGLQRNSFISIYFSSHLRQAAHFSTREEEQ